ncbi:MAG TPA: replicative DNA helicase [Acidimicrobiia bacterium]|nr:replicative DNA helicase [Acidimicrobiia bacterium]
MTTFGEPTQMRPGYRQPPHSREAEESVIGALLLSENAVNEVMDRIHPEDFYVPAHQAIFEAMRELFDTSQAIDAVTVSESLRRKGELDKIGGVQYLTRLVDIVPSTSNVSYYAGIVEEHAKRRELIRAGAAVTEFAFNIDDEISSVLDRAEQTVLGVAEKRTSQTLLEVGPMFQDVLEHIEMLEEQGSEITGLATGFVDLDKKLAGLQPANLVIIAGRPSMGKSSLALNIATNAAATGEPVAIFSLEMSKEEIVQRILSSVGKVDSMKLRSGQLGPLWQRVVDAAGRMYRAPIFIDDSPVVTVTDIRAKCRRLKRKKGLSLVVVDYMQLMDAHGLENRQQEIAQISRNLKNLARELEVPVVAASQLNRSLESREDKRPRLSDLRESGCLPASTKLTRADTGAEVTLGELVLSQEQPLVWSVDDHWRLVPHRLVKTFPTGVKPVYRLKLASGYEVEATGNHKFLTVEGWRALDGLSVGGHIAVPRVIPKPTNGKDTMNDDELILLAHLLSYGSIGPTVRYATSDPANKEIVEETARRLFGIETNAKLHARTWQMHLPSPHHLTHGRHHPIHDWLEPMGLWKSRSHTKFIPEQLHGLPDEKIALFLRHLWATDGSITLSKNRPGLYTSIYYATTSYELAMGIRRLLLRLDIRSRVSARKSGYRSGFHIRIYGKDNSERFLSVVGCHGQRGDVIPEAKQILSGIQTNPDVDLVPWEVERAVKDSLGRSGVTHRELAAHLGEHYCGSNLGGSPDGPRRFSRDRLRRIGELVDDQHLIDLATSDVFWDEITEITPLGEQPTFDATVEGTHNFVANGIVAHNSIEQDADVVMFVYRHEYYHPEDQDKKGIAEIIVAKHRAGSTGPVEMTFQPEFTRFANLGRDVS